MRLTDRQEKLFQFVELKHGEQKRKYTEDPYVTHVLNVAELVSRFVSDKISIEIALCHDLLEDTECDANGLMKGLIESGYNVAEARQITACVIELTDQFTKENYPELNRKERKRLESDRMGTVCKTSISVKYADLIDNTSSIVQYDPGFAKTYLKEKLDIIDKARHGNIHLLLMLCETYSKAVQKLNAETLK